ncbi:LuxR family transcriptional regulator [Paraburkholderia silviterrae]|uniref:LuxR family transcriptional regulator n=1 Tax=Paraburkholderia silviterrae TaxID=2528715 RepID=UPI00196A5DB0|nr:LuxR family transcriptional regulator [Paraburkholderia silviterrae]
MSVDTYTGRTPSILVDRFSHLLEMIYDAALDARKWRGCIEEICYEFSANYASLVIRQSPTLQEDSVIFSGSADRRIVDLRNPHLAQSPFSALPVDRLVTNSDMCPEAQWRASSYYQAWCAPRGMFHVMAIDFSGAGQSLYGFRLTRPESAPPFSNDDRALCERLVRHVRRALDLHRSTHEDRCIASLYSEAMEQLMVGVIVLDESGRILECNAIAREVLQAGDGLNIVGNRVAAAYPTDNRKLQRFVAGALQAESTQVYVDAMAVNRPSGRVGWGVVVRRLVADAWAEGKHRPAAAILVRDPESASHPPVKLAQQLFDLTPAETALSIQLANGLSLEEAMAALNIKRNTARAHLRSIFSKTGARRQTDVVRIFLNSVMLLGTSSRVSSSSASPSVALNTCVAPYRERRQAASV